MAAMRESISDAVLIRRHRRWRFANERDFHEEYHRHFTRHRDISPDDALI